MNTNESSVGSEIEVADVARAVVGLDEFEVVGAVERGDGEWRYRCGCRSRRRRAWAVGPSLVGSRSIGPSGSAMATASSGPQRWCEPSTGSGAAQQVGLTPSPNR